MRFAVVQQGQYFALAYNDFVFARLSKGLCTLFLSLLAQHRLCILAYVSSEACDSEANSWDVQSASQLPIELNIYGRREDAESVGRTLTKAGAYLQFPRYGLEGVEYYNPHFFRMEGYAEQASIETLLLSPPEAVETRDRTSQQEAQVTNADAVDEILGSLSYQNLRNGIQVNSRIKSTLFPYVIVDLHAQALTLTPPCEFSYQKEAIDFILKRETGDVPSELSLWKYNSTDADEPL